MTSGKVILGALAGIAIGASLGILLAPEKGTVTRKRITQKGNGYAAELGGKFNDFIESITERFEEVMDETNHFVENGKVKVEKVNNDLHAAVNSKVR